MEGKPIIKHCQNCQWYKPCVVPGYDGNCTVRYKKCVYPRWRALFCRFFKKKGVTSYENL